MSETEGRAAIVAEAKTWLGTKYHPGANIKGVGVDCGMLIAEVYERAGIIPHMEIAPYTSDYHQHKRDEKYLGYILQHGHQIDPAQRKPGDLCMWKFGLVRSHGAIITDWPLVIHATLRERMVWTCDVSHDVRYPPDKAHYYSFW